MRRSKFQQMMLLSTATLISRRHLSETTRDPMNRFARDRRHWKVGVGGAGGAAQSYTQADNDAAQRAVLAVAQPMLQQVNLTSIPGNNVAQGQIVNVNLNNVGLNTKVTIEVSGTIAQNAAETLTRTPWGLANFFTTIQLTDLANYQRINTSGIHLFALATLKNKGAFGAAFLNDSPVQMGSNFGVNVQPNGVTNAQNFRFFIELPLAYHDYDLRGAIYAAVTSAQWRVTLYINQNVVVPSNSADPLYGCWQSNSAAAGSQGLLTAVTIKVYQHYLNNLPRDTKSGQPIVPLISLAWDYLIQSTTVPNVAAGADFPVQYANFRTFLSTIAIYDNAGVFNAGTDVNYLGIQVANLVYLEQVDPFMQSLRNRNNIMDDFPKGTYVFDHRRKPIDTNQFGNTQFVLNASAASAGASLVMMYEMLSIQSQAVNAGSLAAS